MGGKADSLVDGVKRAATLIDEGMAQQTLNAFIRNQISRIGGILVA